MPHIVGNNVQQRKESLAQLVNNRLNVLNLNPEIIRSRVNAVGHRDTILVNSDVGLMHLTATGSTNPRDSILITAYGEIEQAYLEDKAFIAFGWNAEDGRAFVMFVAAESVRGYTNIQKQRVVELRDKSLSCVLPPQIDI